jgi:hypothetical protein
VVWKGAGLGETAAQVLLDQCGHPRHWATGIAVWKGRERELPTWPLLGSNTPTHARGEPQGDGQHARFDVEALARRLGSARPALAQAAALGRHSRQPSRALSLTPTSRKWAGQPV